MKKLLIGLLVVVVILLIWWWASANKAAAPTPDENASSTPAVADNSGEAIEAEFQGLSETDLNAEFQSIDQDINKL